MKQPKKDDNRPKILSKDITKAQHIIPAKIIKKWKQHGVLRTRIKNNPKLQYISNERNELFCVYHRWVQGVEKQKTKIEKEFYKLIDEWEKSPSNLIIDDRNQKEQEIILNYFYAINVCNFFKTSEGNSYQKLNLLLNEKEKEIFQQRARQATNDGYNREWHELNNLGYIDEYQKTDISQGVFISNVYQRTHFYIYNNKNDPRAIWYYIKTKERLYLLDCYKSPIGMDNKTAGIINISPYSVLISQHFVNTYLRCVANVNNFDLSQLDINNPPICCKKVISFVKIINHLALNSYDKWIIM